MQTLEGKEVRGKRTRGFQRQETSGVSVLGFGNCLVFLFAIYLAILPLLLRVLSSFSCIRVVPA